MPQDKLKL